MGQQGSKQADGVQNGVQQSNGGATAVNGGNPTGSILIKQGSRSDSDAASSAMSNKTHPGQVGNEVTLGDVTEGQITEMEQQEQEQLTEEQLKKAEEFVEKAFPQSTKVSKDDFEHLKVLGDGCFGKVMLVRHKGTDDLYAMKSIHKDHVIRTRRVQQTRTERDLMSKVRHPFVMQLHFAFQSDGKLYLVMDFYSGGDLFYRLSRERRFSEDRARFYAAEIVLALESLHAEGFIYRDLKPENVLIGGDGHICLTDFGLSKDLTEGEDTVHTFVGTAEYLAPEVLRRKGYTRAVDWWSLGVMIFEMIVGNPPFYSKNRQITFRMILSAELLVPDWVSPEATSLMRGLMMRDPKRRLGGTEANGASKIRDHPFFKGIDWGGLLAKTVPASFVPSTGETITDAINFDERFVKKTPMDSPVTESMAEQAAGSAFQNFTYVAPHAFPADMEESATAAESNHILGTPTENGVHDGDDYSGVSNPGPDDSGMLFGMDED